MGGDEGSKSAGVLGSLLDTKGGSGRTLRKYDPVLWPTVEVWSCDCWCFCFRAKTTDSDPDPDPDPDPGSTVLPSSNPPVDAPRFVVDALNLLHKWSLPCHGWRNENVAPNKAQTTKVLLHARAELIKEARKAGYIIVLVVEGCVLFVCTLCRKG